MKDPKQTAREIANASGCADSATDNLADMIESALREASNSTPFLMGCSFIGIKSGPGSPSAYTMAVQALPPEGHIITADGSVRRVLGELPVLASGEYLGGTSSDDYPTVPLTVWAVHPASGEIAECHGWPKWTELDDWRVRAKDEDAEGNARVFKLAWCHSTLASAQAARTEVGRG